MTFVILMLGVDIIREPKTWNPNNCVAVVVVDVVAGRQTKLAGCVVVVVCGEYLLIVWPILIAMTMMMMIVCVCATGVITTLVHSVTHLILL